MKYRKVRAVWKDAPGSLNRSLRVREDIGLLELAGVILTAFHEDDSYDMQLIDKGEIYGIPEEDTFDISRYSLQDVSRSFYLRYDLNDPWIFDISVSGKIVEEDEEYLAKILSGKGKGICEDHRSELLEQLQDAAKRREFETIDLQEENVYLVTHADACIERYRDELPEAEECDALMDYLDRADEAYEEAEENRLSMQAWKEFVRIAEAHRQDAPLPPALMDFIREIDPLDDPDELYADIMGIIDTLYFNSAWEDVMQVYEQMVELFPADRMIPEDLILERVECLHHLGRVDEAMYIAQQAAEKDPDNMTLKGLILEILMTMGDMQKAADYAAEVEVAPSACSPDNVYLCSRLRDYYQAAGKKKLARAMKKAVEETFAQMHEELFEEDDDEEDLDDHPGLILMEHIDTYDEDPTEENFRNTLYALLYVCHTGYELYPRILLHKRKGDQVGVQTMVGEDGEVTLPVYSCRNAADRDDFKVSVSYELDDLVKWIEEEDADGITFDPINNVHRFVLTLDGLKELLELSEDIAEDFAQSDSGEDPLRS